MFKVYGLGFLVPDLGLREPSGRLKAMAMSRGLNTFTLSRLTCLWVLKPKRIDIYTFDTIPATNYFICRTEICRLPECSGGSGSRA